MTTRERFLAIVNCERPDYVPYWYAPGIGIAHKEHESHPRALRRADGSLSASRPAAGLG